MYWNRSVSNLVKCYETENPDSEYTHANNSAIRTIVDRVPDIVIEPTYPGDDGYCH